MLGRAAHSHTTCGPGIPAHPRHQADTAPAGGFRLALGQRRPRGSILWLLLHKAQLQTHCQLIVQIISLPGDGSEQPRNQEGGPTSAPTCPEGAIIWGKIWSASPKDHLFTAHCMGSSEKYNCDHVSAKMGKSYISYCSDLHWRPTRGAQQPSAACFLTTRSLSTEQTHPRPPAPRVTVQSDRTALRSTAAKKHSRPWGKDSSAHAFR